jgi:hypothetical protein
MVGAIRPVWYDAASHSITLDAHIAPLLPCRATRSKRGREGPLLLLFAPALEQLRRSLRHLMTFGVKQAYIGEIPPAVENLRLGSISLCLHAYFA